MKLPKANKFKRRNLGDTLLDYLKKNAQKAYREISSIIENPGFLFSNDPRLAKREASCNYYYIHGFNRLIKNNRVSNDQLIDAFRVLEDNIELYLKEHYRNKNFIYYLNGDALVPAFTLSVLSYHEGNQIKESMKLIELIDWYKNNACFNGLRILEVEQEKLSEEILDDEYPDTFRSYVKLIET